MKAVLAGLGVSLFTAVLAWGSSIVDPAGWRNACLTHEDVVRHEDRSRNGIALSCTSEIRQRHAQREAQRHAQQ